MSVECTTCHTATDLVGFRRPATDPAKLNLLRGIMILAALASVYSVWELLQDAIDVTQMAKDSEALLVNDQTFPSETVRDGARLFVNTALAFFGIVLVVMILIPVRYSILATKVTWGHPTTWVRMRRIAKVQFGMGALTLFLAFFLFGNTETLHPDPRVGFQMILAPAILWISNQGWARAHFSAHELKRLQDGPMATNPPCPTTDGPTPGAPPSDPATPTPEPGPVVAPPKVRPPPGPGQS